MYSTRTSPEWRDDIPRSFSSTVMAPHVPAVRQHRRRRLTTALLIPRLTSAHLVAAHIASTHLATTSGGAAQRR